MLKQYLKKTTALVLFGMVGFMAVAQSNSTTKEKPKPRILVSSDIGGTDPDDFQSMIHLMMYSDLFQIEGLVSSPFGDGRKKHFLDMIDLYEKDFPKLTTHNKNLTNPNDLRKVCKQGTIPSAPFKGYSTATEGSEWIIKCAKQKNNQPLWVLVWGGLEDLAQALHDSPEIEKKIKVYWIGGPNKKWSINAYSYIAKNHPNLWMIEANATYRGWIIDSESPKEISSEAYYGNYIQGRGAMGKAFKNYYNGNVKMGDTPSLAYLMNGDPNNPLTDSWGGSFTPINRSSRNVFERNTTIKDTVAAYAVLEWRFKGPKMNVPKDSACFIFEAGGQKWPGYCLGEGVYAVRYSSKKQETCTYVTTSSIPELNEQKGQFVSTIPWPGKQTPDDYKLGKHWYGDRQEPELFLEQQQGAKTISKFRSEFLLDWAKRWEWLN
ncbi:protein of unknown function [Flavobacterium fluvii]|uniref:Uncharacterized protein n=1 Tax=Flavobacterium fluvii TaxID=468056 RepID=A0A1M5HTL0_9FLAO|nr:nucleoside hydrolase-like domain-containing protein [Flavobacterium fluvii]SHG19296.1 protein of unknown function [Flavobacterium fluvii]